MRLSDYISETGSVSMISYMASLVVGTLRSISLNHWIPKEILAVLGFRLLQRCG